MVGLRKQDRGFRSDLVMGMLQPWGASAEK